MGSEQRRNYFWNAMGGLVNAVSSVVLAIIVNRVLGSESGGIFSLAFATAQLMQTVGQFETRQYQVTDVAEQYSFADYRRFRLCTCALMALVTALYAAFYTASGGTYLAAVALLTAYKELEVYADIFGGRFQQQERIDIAGRLLFFRVMGAIAAFTVTLLLTKELLAALAAMPVYSAAQMALYDRRYMRPAQAAEGGWLRRHLPEIARETAPMFCQSFCWSYIGNAPKYAVSALCSYSAQNIYSILFTPSFVINMFGNFLFSPILTHIAASWQAGQRKRFLRSVFGVMAAILGVTLLALAGTYFLGIPLLSALYGVSLEGYRGELLFVMASGGISALVMFLYNVITAMRCQRWLALGYGCAFAIALLAAKPLVARSGIQGGFLTYALSVGSMAFIYLGIFFVRLRRKR